MPRKPRKGTVKPCGAPDPEGTLTCEDAEGHYPGTMHSAAGVNGGGVLWDEKDGVLAASRCPHPMCTRENGHDGHHIHDNGARFTCHKQPGHTGPCKMTELGPVVAADDQKAAAMERAAAQDKEREDRTRRSHRVPVLLTEREFGSIKEVAWLLRMDVASFMRAAAAERIQKAIDDSDVEGTTGLSTTMSSLQRAKP